MSQVPPKVRDLIVEREDQCCFRCLGWAEGGSIHHRKLRSRGGRNDPSNLMLLCGSGTTGCHGWVHSNVLAATALGYMVESWEEPRYKRTWSQFMGRDVYLTDAGGFLDISGIGIDEDGNQTVPPPTQPPMGVAQ
jgi:hypothetical protein